MQELKLLNNYLIFSLSSSTPFFNSNDRLFYLNFSMTKILKYLNSKILSMKEIVIIRVAYVYNLSEAPLNLNNSIFLIKFELGLMLSFYFNLTYINVS